MKSEKSIVHEILRTHGRTFSDELGIRVERNTPSPLFRLLVFALLSSARISHRLAIKAAKALSREGWNTPKKMTQATWEHRAHVLNRSGYARYDESTSRMLEDTSNILQEEYKGDLRNLREEAERDPKRERILLKKFKGIGDVGVDIFFREVQVAWDELVPFADNRVLKAARRLGLGNDVSDLHKIVKGRDFVRLVAGLVRVELKNDSSPRELSPGIS